MGGGEGEGVLYLYLPVYIHTYIHTYIHILYIHTMYIHTYAHTYIHAYLYIHTYMCHGAGAKVGWIKEYRGLTFTM